jgi:hypothetical protein
LHNVLNRVTVGNDGLISYRIGEPPPPGTVALGPIEVDFGNGRIDMRSMTPAEKETVLANKGAPDPAPQIEGARFTPHVKRMSE